MYTLYYSPGSASMVVHLALLEAGLLHRLELVDFERPRSADYLRLNPQGQVPTLVAGNEVITESAAILLWLGDRHPESGLAPAIGDPLRGLYLQTVVSMSNQLMSTFRLWFYPPDLGNPEHPQALSAALQVRIAAVWARLDAQLAARGPYLLGERFSGADLLATMLMRWSRNMPRPALEWPALARLAGLVKARPSWRRLCEIEGLTGW
jgi:glutathione S-transferase